MKPPFWVVNSALLILIALSLGLTRLLEVRIPSREDIEPVKYTKIKREQALSINIASIYEHDPFGTYRKEKPKPVVGDLSMPLPEPPRPISQTLPEQPKPQFLDPLDITLRGIIVIASDPSKNSAIVSDNKTKKESIFKVGDTFEDAMLIKIFSNKVIFLRSNGQQEVLYLREQDAKTDPAYVAGGGDWEPVADRIGDNLYVVNPKEFIQRVQTLAQFIDMLGLTTAYKNGKSIGSRVGQLAENSFGRRIGLATGDIITSVDDISTAQAEDRMKIFQHIVYETPAREIPIRIMRKGQELTLDIIIRDFSTQEQKEAQGVPAPEEDLPSLQKLQEHERLNILKEKYKFAPTLRDIREQERRNMIGRGSQPARKSPSAAR
jgi:type II secretory pathway component PulC